MSNSMTPERQALISMSKQAKAIQEQIEATTGERPTINSILIEMHQKAANCKVFKFFNEWRAEGFKVKKDSKAYRIWGSPKKAKKSQAQADNATSNTTIDDGDSHYKFFPMACLFSENQVEKI